MSRSLFYIIILSRIFVKCIFKIAAERITQPQNLLK